MKNVYKNIEKPKSFKNALKIIKKDKKKLEKFTLIFQHQ